MNELTKTCQHCKELFSKRNNYSLNYWYTAKYCSHVCSREALPEPHMGKPHSEESKSKMSISHKQSFVEDPTLYVRLSMAAKGKRRSPATEIKKGNIPWNKGKHNPYSAGENNFNWKGGITSLNEKIRKSIVYRSWRKSVFDRDDYICQACGIRGGELHADHELPFSVFPDLRFEILNGRTLCVPCHRKTPTWGDIRAINKLHLVS